MIIEELKCQCDCGCDNPSGYYHRNTKTTYCGDCKNSHIHSLIRPNIKEIDFAFLVERCVKEA